MNDFRKSYARPLRLVAVQGFTLIEALIALGILGIVMAMAYGAIVGSVGIQAGQEATVSAQAKLRRVVEVLSQDVRSAVFGSLIDQPYSTSGTQVSFLLLTGGAGYALDKYGLGQSQVKVIGGATTNFAGRTVLVVNQQGKGQLLRVTSASAGAGKQTLSLSCPLNVGHTTNTLLFEVDTLGVSLDSVSGQLNFSTDSAAGAAPFAFDISEFRIQYIYTAEGHDPVVQETPSRVAGAISKTLAQGGVEYTLSQLQLVIGTDAVTRSGIKRHVYTAQIAVASNGDYALKELSSCI